MDRFLIITICILVLAVLAILAFRKKQWYILAYPVVIAILICITILSDESHVPIRMNGCDLKHDVGWANGTYLYIDESNNNGYGGAWARMNKYALNKGTYTVILEYGTNVEGNLITVVDDGEYILYDTLSPEGTTKEITFTLEKDSQEIVIQLNYIGYGSLFAYSMELSAENGFYQDAGYYVGILILLGIAGVLLYFYAQKRNLPGRKVAITLGLVILSVFSFVPLLMGELPWGDDICYHLIRIEGIKDGLLDGQLPVMIYPEGLKGYGYTNLMYPSLFLYLPALVRMLGVSIAASYKTLILVLCFATAFLTYYSMHSIFRNEKAAMLAAVLYTLCPYRYTNLYARAAIGEAIAFTFLPLLIAGLYQLICGDKKKWWILALAMTGLMESHVLSVFLGGMLCVVCAVIYIRRIFTEKRWLPLLKCIGLFVLLNAGFLVPFLSMYKDGGLWMAMLGISKYGEYSLDFRTLFGTFTNVPGYRLISLGFSVTLMAGVGIFYYVKRMLQGARVDAVCETDGDSAAVAAEPSDASGEQEDVQAEADTDSANGFMLFLLVMGCVFVLLLLGQFRAFKFMQINAFKWFFETVQFPWRLLGPASACFVMVGSYCLFKERVLQKSAMLFAVGLMLISGVATTRYEDDDFSYEAYDSTYTQGHESKVIGIPKGDNTIVYPYEWRQEGVYDDILVVNAVRATDQSQLTVESYHREGTTTQLTYITSMDGMEIELPILYYPGYELRNEHGAKIPCYPGNNNLVAFKAQADGIEHSVTLTFHKGFLFTTAFWISILTAVGGLAYLVLKKYAALIPVLKEHAGSDGGENL